MGSRFPRIGRVVSTDLLYCFLSLFSLPLWVLRLCLHIPSVSWRSFRVPRARQGRGVCNRRHLESVGLLQTSVRGLVYCKEIWEKEERVVGRCDLIINQLKAPQLHVYVYMAAVALLSLCKGKWTTSWYTSKLTWLTNTYTICGLTCYMMKVQPSNMWTACVCTSGHYINREYRDCLLYTSDAADE